MQIIINPWTLGWAPALSFAYANRASPFIRMIAENHDMATRGEIWISFLFTRGNRSRPGTSTKCQLNNQSVQAQISNPNHVHRVSPRITSNVIHSKE